MTTTPMTLGRFFAQHETLLIDLLLLPFTDAENVVSLLSEVQRARRDLKRPRKHTRRRESVAEEAARLLAKDKKRVQRRRKERGRRSK